MIILLGVFTISSSGFFIAEYFCNTCNFEHTELALLDINKSHEHTDCTICEHDTGKCLCTTHDFDEKNVDFFSLDNLFFSSQKNLVHDVNELFVNNIILLKSFASVFLQADINIYQNLPPPFDDKIPTPDFSVLFSVFIL